MSHHCPPEPARQAVPKDGFGPRGAPDCYYTSRVLNSTYRYVKFVKKLRADEEDKRQGDENKLKELRDQQTNDFFIRCDRRALVNKVASKVDLCFESYEQDLNKKRKKLLELLALEEEANIRKFVEQAQAGAEAVWQDKKKRLQYLLDKRKKEHEEKYKDTPLSKCVHVLPCLYKLRAKEAEEIQLYQIKEKQARRMAEIEFDKMWHAVTMKESEALAARMEQDAIERYRRDLECKQYTDYQLEQKRIQRDKEKQMLKEETLRFKSIWENDIKKEEEAEQLRKDKSKQTAIERKEMLEERAATLAKKKAEEDAIAKIWDDLAGQGLADEKAKIELRKKKERELNECNKKLLELKTQMANIEAGTEDIVKEMSCAQQKAEDKRRCEYLLWAQKTNREVRQAMVDQIKEKQKARENLKQKLAEQEEYQRQVHDQLQQLIAHKELTDAENRKKYQRDLLEQMEYNKLLKERARQEELEQMKKFETATRDYQEEMNRMLCRPFFSDEIHPFMKPMAKGLKMKEKCPCSKPDYCK